MTRALVVYTIFGLTALDRDLDPLGIIGGGSMPRTYDANGLLG